MLERVRGAVAERGKLQHSSDAIVTQIAENCAAPAAGELGGFAAGFAPGPLFVAGVWRSGTSLFYALLNQHPKIALMYEADLPMLRPFFLLGSRNRRWFARWDFWAAAATRHGLSPEEIPAQLSTAKAAAQWIYRDYARRKSATVWGEKSPNYCESLPRVAREFRDARFIIVWRDPVDICRSVARAARTSGWFARPGTLHRALLAARELKKSCDRLLARGVPVHQIQYQELIQNPQLVMQGVCGFLSIPYDSRMASLEGADRSAVASGEHHELVKGGDIIAGPRSSDPLLSDFRCKAERYIRLWRKQTHGNWPRGTNGAAADGPEPSPGERLVDSALYWALRRFDRLAVLGYSVAPYWVLRKYRRSKQNRVNAASQSSVAQDSPKAQPAVADPYSDS